MYTMRNFLKPSSSSQSLLLILSNYVPTSLLHFFLLLMLRFGGIPNKTKANICATQSLVSRVSRQKDLILKWGPLSVNQKYWKKTFLQPKAKSSGTVKTFFWFFSVLHRSYRWSLGNHLQYKILTMLITESAVHVFTLEKYFSQFAQLLYVLPS